jgi:hypothetical protein
VSRGFILAGVESKRSYWRCATPPFVVIVNRDCMPACTWLTKIERRLAGCVPLLFQDDFLRPFVVTPTQERCLPQLIVRRQFGVLDFTDQFRPYPLDLLFNVGRIDERTLVDERRLHPICRILQAFLAKARTRISVVPELSFGISAKHDSTEVFPASFGRRESSDYELLL